MNENKDWGKTVKQYHKFLQALRLYPELDKIKIAEKTNVSPPTLYKAFDDLKEQLLVNGDTRINPLFGTFVGISIGTSLCKVVFLHFDFTEYDKEDFKLFKDEILQLHNIDIITNDTNNDYDYVYFKTPDSFGQLKQYLDIIFDVIQKLVREDKLNLLSIGISSTGSIDEKKQVIRQAHNLSYLDGRTIDDLYFSDKKVFFQSNNIPIFLVQNSTAAVIAEKFKIHQNEKDLKDNKNLVAVYLEYGIGAGFIINGKLYSGTNGYAGEIGHIPVPITMLDQCQDLIKIKNFKVNSKCTCGATGCIDHVVRSLAFSEFDTNYKYKNSDDLYKYFCENDKEAKCLGMILGYITNTLAAILNVDLVIFTGKLYKSMPVLKKHIEKSLDENNLKYNRCDCKIYESKIGTLAPAIGAAIYSYYKNCDIEIEWV